MSTPIIKPSAYLASIGPLTDIPIIDGNVSLDGARVPYAVATVTVARSEIADLDDVDPRASIRAEIIATDGATTRDFDLSVQSMDVDENAGTVTFGLTSDEALLQQYTAMADDFTQADNYSTSIGSPNIYALSLVTGATLTGSDAAAVEVRAESENLIRNPRVGANLTDWVMVGGLTVTRYTSGGPDVTTAPTYWGAQAGGSGSAGAQVFIDQTAVSVSGGKKYVLSAWVYADGSRPMQLDGVIFDGTNNPIAYTATSTIVPGSAWRQLVIEFTTGANAARFRPRVTPVGGLAGSEYIRVSAWRLSEWTGGGANPAFTGQADIEYFDGARAATGGYSYSWADVAHASISKRAVTIDHATPEVMTWHAGDSAWDYLAPINTYYNRRLWCDEDRLWRLMNPDTWSVAGTITITGMNATQASNMVALGNPTEYATGVIVRYRWTSIDGLQNEVLDIAGTPDQVRQVELNSPYPGPGAAQAILDRMAGRGAMLTVTAISNFLATPGKTAAVTLPGSSTVNLYLASVEWNLNDGLMQVGTRALI